MNKRRREEISEVVGTLQDCKSKLENIKDEEDTSRENMPENMEGSQRYEDSETASERIDDAIADLESAIDNLGEATS